MTGIAALIGGRTFEREKSILCNRFIRKRGVGLFFRVGIFLREYTVYDHIVCLSSACYRGLQLQVTVVFLADKRVFNDV